MQDWHLRFELEVEGAPLSCLQRHEEGIRKLTR